MPSTLAGAANPNATQPDAYVDAEGVPQTSDDLMRLFREKLGSAFWARLFLERCRDCGESPAPHVADGFVRRFCRTV